MSKSDLSQTTTPYLCMSWRAWDATCWDVTGLRLFALSTKYPPGGYGPSHIQIAPNHQRCISSCIDTVNCSTTTFLATLVRQCRGVTQPVVPSVAALEGAYVGGPLDALLSTQEFDAALGSLRRKSAPGPDGISNQALKSLLDVVKTRLLRWFRDIWVTCGIPPF